MASEYNLKGKTPPAMPKYAGSISASYRFDLPTGTLTPRVEVTYRGAEWARIFNLGAIDYLPAYTQTNLNIEYKPTGSKLRVSLAATNLFDVNGLNGKYTNPYGVRQPASNISRRGRSSAPSPTPSISAWDVGPTPASRCGAWSASAARLE